jgi:hypothetical protein
LRIPLNFGCGFDDIVLATGDDNLFLGHGTPWVWFRMNMRCMRL